MRRQSFCVPNMLPPQPSRCHWSKGDVLDSTAGGNSRPKRIHIETWAPGLAAGLEPRVMFPLDVPNCAEMDQGACHLTCPSPFMAHSLGDEVAFSWAFKPDPAAHLQRGLWDLWLRTAQSGNAPEKHHCPLPVASIDLPLTPPHPPTPTSRSNRVGQAWGGFLLVNCFFFFPWQGL